MGMTGPGKDKVYTLAMCIIIFFSPFLPHHPHLMGGWCELHKGREFCVWLMNISYMCRTVSEVKSFSCVWLFATPWCVAHQAPLFMGFSRQEYWSGLPFPSPGALPNPGTEPRSPALQADALTSEPPSVSVQFSCSVVSDSLRPHEPQHTRPLYPSPTPRVYSNPCPLSRWCHPAISSSVVPFSSCPQSLPASGSFPMSQLFAWGGQSTKCLAHSKWLINA